MIFLFNVFVTLVNPFLCHLFLMWGHRPGGKLINAYSTLESKGWLFQVHKTLSLTRALLVGEMALAICNS